MTEAQVSSGVPVAKVVLEKSAIKFGVKASVPIKGVFVDWNATLTFRSTDPDSAVLDIKIQAASVDTGSHIKNNELKSKDFFNAVQDPLITFHSTKIEQTGPDTFDVHGLFTIRGVCRPEKLAFTVNGKGTSSGEIQGTMVFDRKNYGMAFGIPFIKIADRVEVTVDMKIERVSGPLLVFKQ